VFLTTLLHCNQGGCVEASCPNFDIVHHHGADEGIDALNILSQSLPYKELVSECKVGCIVNICVLLYTVF